MPNYSKLLGQALFIIFLIQITIQQQYSLSSYGSNQEVGLASGTVSQIENIFDSQLSTLFPILKALHVLFIFKR